MSVQVQPNGQACGAIVKGVDLTNPLSDTEVSDIRKAWLEHHVLIFPNQPMNDDDLERFSLYFGEFGVDPFIKPLAGRKNIIAVQREADETSPIFADIWHTDWSFQKMPPAGTCLFSVDIPPEGGDTLFANQELALKEMPQELRSRLEGKVAIHSAEVGYSKEGAYGDRDEGRSMVIEASDEAKDRMNHWIIRKHPESGKEVIFGTAIAYIVGMADMHQKEGMDLIMELQRWQTQGQFVYRHKWEKDMLVMWDNRSVLHKATGGYEGYRRELHRTTVADTPALHRYYDKEIKITNSADMNADTYAPQIVIKTNSDILSILKKAVEDFGGIQRSVRFDFGSVGTFHVQGTTITNENKKAECSISMSLDDLNLIVNGELDVMSAVMAGKVKVEGDSSIAISIQGLF